MRVEDMKFIIDANGQYLELRSDKVKTAAKQHTELAVVVRPAFIYLSYPFICFPKSLFAAVVKIILIQVIAPNITGFSDIPTSESAKIDFFSFGALAFDILGAVLILRSARTLFIKANEANATHKVKVIVRDVVLSGATPSWLLGSGDIPDGFLGMRFMGNPLDISFGGISLCYVGMVFFLVSLCLLMIATHRVVVWVPMIVPGLVTMTWYSFKDAHNNMYVVGQVGQLTSRSG
jgi:hypothetical protein